MEKTGGRLQVTSAALSCQIAIGPMAIGRRVEATGTDV